MNVTNLKQAYRAYWDATNHREMQAAYHEILLYGGNDGYPISSPWRETIAKALRRAALWIERR